MASSSELRNQKSAKITERGIYVARQQGVDNIIRNMDFNLETCIANVNNMIATCAGCLSSGLKGKKGNIEEDIQTEMEERTYTDTTMSSSRSNLSEESSRCGNEINRLDSEIVTLDWQIQAAEAREEEERRRAWEAAYWASMN